LKIYGDVVGLEWLLTISIIFLSPHRAAQIGSFTMAERHSDFRSESFLSSSLAAPRQTGLSILMNTVPRGGKPQSILGTMAAMHAPSGNDMDDRERQAKSLAAAGMVAESVRISQQQLTALQPPPLLASPNHFYQQSSSTEVDANNWGNTTMDDNNIAMQIDDLDLDFATLFDPALEEAHMRVGESIGWPNPNDSNFAISPTHLGETQQQGDRI
jgi:hypothetical protein